MGFGRTVTGTCGKQKEIRDGRRRKSKRNRATIKGEAHRSLEEPLRSRGIVIATEPNRRMEDVKVSGGLLQPASSLNGLRTLAFLSGCAALIYEIVWFQLLQLIIGSSAISVGVLLGTYMGGMCLGSLVIPCLISRRWNPLRACALLEVGIGLMGLLILLVLPEVTALYSSHRSEERRVGKEC